MSGAARRERSRISFGYELFIALRYLGAKRKQTFVSLITFISTLGVGVGTAALVISLALMTGFEQDIKERIFGGNAHIIVERLRGREIGEIRSVLSRISSVPGVVAGSPVAEGFGLLSGGPTATAKYAVFYGVDPALEAKVTSIPSSMVSGSFQQLQAWKEGESQPPVVLGADMARALGVDTGDAVQATLVSSRLTPWGVLPRTLWFRVGGIFDAGFFEYNSVRCYLPIALASRLFNVDGATWISVRLRDASLIPEAEEGIRRGLGQDFYVDDMPRQNRSLLSAMRLEKVLMFIAISLIVMVAALNIVSTLILLVMEKVRDIGALVAMGATSRGIMALFLIQGLVIGLVGTVSGVSLGLVTTKVMDHLKWPALDPDVYYLSHVPFRAQPLDALGVALLAVAISFLATLYPSWKASRLDPVQALRYE